MQDPWDIDFRERLAEFHKTMQAPKLTEEHVKAAEEFSKKQQEKLDAAVRALAMRRSESAAAAAAAESSDEQKETEGGGPDSDSGSHSPVPRDRGKATLLLLLPP